MCVCVSEGEGVCRNVEVYNVCTICVLPEYVWGRTLIHYSYSLHLYTQVLRYTRTEKLTKNGENC